MSNGGRPAVVSSMPSRIRFTRPAIAGRPAAIFDTVMVLSRSRNHPAVRVGQGDRRERLARMQRREHLLRRHHLLHELAVVRRGRLQRRIGVRQLRPRLVDLLVQRRRAGPRSPDCSARPAAAPASGRRAGCNSVSSLPFRSRCRRIASPTFGSRVFSASVALAWAICWLVMLPCASCAAVNISASSCLRAGPSAAPAACGIDIEAGRHQLRRRARPSAPSAPSPRSWQIGSASSAVTGAQQLTGVQQIGLRQRLRSGQRPAERRGRLRQFRQRLAVLALRRRGQRGGAVQPGVEDRPRQSVARAPGRSPTSAASSASAGLPSTRSTTARLRRTSISPSKADCARGSVSRP